MKPFGYIYLITNLINRKVYVGKTESTINKRWYTHNWRAKHIDKVEKPLVIDLAITKYGENSFEIEELDKAFNKEDLLRVEAYWIKYYDATNPDKGYNIDPMGEITYSDDYESIWQIPNISEKSIQKYTKWRESLIKKKLPKERQQEFKRDIKYLSGVQLEKKYSLYPNRRALLREIRRILQDESIESIEQAKKVVCGQVYDPKKRIPPEKEDEFIKDFKLLTGINLENKYAIKRRGLVRNVKEIFKKQGLRLLDIATTFEEVKEILGGKIYDPKKRISLEREQEFKDDIKKGLKERELLQKYGLGTSVFYRELERILGVKKLTEIRETEFYSPPIKKYIPNERQQEFINDLKILSGNQLEKKYGITHRSRLLREIRRVLDNENLNSMEFVKKFLGGKVYSRAELKKGVPLDKEQEFKEDIRNGINRRVLCKKYKFGIKALYRELERLFNTRLLVEARKK